MQLKFLKGTAYLAGVCAEFTAENSRLLASVSLKSPIPSIGQFRSFQTEIRADWISLHVACCMSL
jgi:hypothetical protein